MVIEQKRSGVLHVFTNILPEPYPENLPPEVPSRRWMYWQMVRAVALKALHAPFSIHSWASLRRHLLATLLPDNILYRYKAYQRGECNRPKKELKRSWSFHRLVDQSSSRSDSIVAFHSSRCSR